MSKLTDEIRVRIAKADKKQLQQMAASSGFSLADVTRAVIAHNLKHYSLEIVDRMKRNGRDR